MLLLLQTLISKSNFTVECFYCYRSPASGDTLQGPGDKCCLYVLMNSCLPDSPAPNLFSSSLMKEKRHSPGCTTTNALPNLKKKKKVFNLAGHYFILIFIYYLAFRKMFFPSLPFSSRSLVLLSHK